MSWLKKRFEELSAQVNMRDGGKTASTVRAARNKPAPVQTKSTLSVGAAPAQNLRVGNTDVGRSPELTTSGVRASDLQRAQELRNQQKPLSDKLRVFDANTASDRLKRLQKGEAEVYVDQQRDKGIRRAPNNIGQAVAGLAAQNLNTLSARTQEIPETVRGTTAQLTNNQDALSASLKRQDDLRKKLYTNQKSGLLGSGTIYDSVDEAKSLGVAETAKRVGAGQLEMASLPLGGAVLGSAGKEGFKQGVKYLGSRAGMQNLATLSAAGAMGAGGDELGRNTNVTPQSFATAAVTGALAAPALGVAGAGAGAITRPVARAAGNKVIKPTTNLVKSVQLPNPRVNIEEQNILRDYSDALVGANTARGAELSDLITMAREVGAKHGIDLTNGSVVERLERTNLVLDQIGKAQRASLLENEGGYIAGSEGQPKPPRKIQVGKQMVEPSTRLVSSSKNSVAPTTGKKLQDPTTLQEPQIVLPKDKGQQNQTRPKLNKEVQQNPDLSLNRANGLENQTQPQTQLLQSKAQKSSEIPRENPSKSKIQQKTPVVNEAKRAVAGAERTTYGLRESFDKGENVPNELKEVLGAFGNERTVKSNKELWQNAQRRVSEDAPAAMKYFGENTGDEAVATGYALISRYMKGGNTKQAGEIAMTMAERALEAGRTTQAYALMKRLTPEGSIQYVENKVARFTKQNPKQASKLNWNDKVRKELYDIADKVNSLPEGRERNLTIGRMQQLVDNIFPSSVADKAVTVWKAGLLTSLRTHERNILGNSINAAAEQVSTAPGSIVDRIMSLRTGKRTLVASLGEGYGKGVKTGAQIAKDQIRTGIDVTNSNLKYNINHITWGDNKVEKTLKGFTETVFRPLGAEDKLFKEGARSNSLYNQALAAASTKKLKGNVYDDYVRELAKNPTPKMRELADDDAGRATFSQDNFLGDIIRDAKGAVRRSNKPGAKAASTVLDILMPFTQVPSGVASQLYAYSPAKLAKSTYDIGKVLITGDPEFQRSAAQGFGRSVVGTSLLGAGAYLANQGMLTGQPKDDAEKTQWEAQGIKSNSVKVGDRWYGLSSIGPQNLLLLAGAQFEADKKGDENAYTNIAANLGKNFKDQTFLKGMSSALDAVGDPQRYADSFVQQQATSIVPNIIKDIARALDPNERETKSISDRFKQSIPGASTTLPERKDSYGQTLKNSGVAELLDLFNSSKEKDVSAAEFVDQLRNTTSLKDHVPSKVEKKITINGEQRKLTAKEYSEYQNFVGNESKRFIESAKTSLSGLSDEEKVKKIDSTLKDINEAAKIKLFGADSKKASKNAKRILSGQEPSMLSSKINDSIKEEHKATLSQYELMDETERDDYIRKNNDAEYKVALAKYENDKAEGKISRVEDMKRTKELKRHKAGSSFDKDIREFYSMSKGEIEDYIFSNDDGKAVANKLIALDDALVKAGVITKNKFRDKYGGVNFKSASEKAAGKGKGKKSKAGFDYTSNLFDTKASSTSVSKSLRSILESAMSGKA